MIHLSILKDTGANRSLLLKGQGVIDRLPTNYLNTSTLVKGVGDGFVSVPLHRYFCSLKL